MEPVDVILEQVGHAFCAKCHMRGYDMDLFGEPVDEDTDCVITVRFWQLAYEVTRDRVPGSWWSFIRIKRSLRHLTSRLGSLTALASRDISVDICRDSGPEIVPLNKFARTLLARVACSDRVMMRDDDIFTEFLVPGHVESFLEHDVAIFFTPISIVIF